MTTILQLWVALAMLSTLFWAVAGFLCCLIDELKWAVCCCVFALSSFALEIGLSFVFWACQTSSR